jgi:hypothetical protein
METLINPPRGILSGDRDHRKVQIIEPLKEFMNWDIYLIEESFSDKMFSRLIRYNVSSFYNNYRVKIIPYLNCNDLKYRSSSIVCNHRAWRGEWEWLPQEKIRAMGRKGRKIRD